MADIQFDYTSRPKLVEVKDLCKWFPVKRTIADSLLRREVRYVKAVDHVSLDIYQGECLGLVGESGCGKSTLARTIIRLYEPTSGEILLEGTDIAHMSARELRPLRPHMQMIFQDPYSSLDPRMTVLDIIKEPLVANYKKTMSDKEMNDKVISIAAKVGLNTTYLKRYPHAFSGGQRQRIGIARALVVDPKIVICDEAVSALDVSVQAQVINLLRDLQKEFHLTYLFISHDLSVVEHISNKVGVMYLGRMVEYAPTDALFSRPLHPYTEALLSAVPIPDPKVQIERIPLKGEIPNPANPPSGCYFHERCSYCCEKCCHEVPPYVEAEPGHFVACHRASELKLRGFDYE